MGWIILITFTSVFLAIIGLATLVGVVKSPVEERIDRLYHPKKHMPEISTPAFHSDNSFLSWLGKRMAPNDPKQRSLSKQRLTMAGYYSDTSYNAYWGIKIVAMIGLPLLVFFLFSVQPGSIKQAFYPIIISIGFGMFLPDIMLQIKKRQRQEQIFCGLPDALDLLVVCIEAGLGLDAAMQKVSEEFHLSNRVLSDELNLCCSTIRMGHPRNEALHDLGERTGVLDLKALVAVLIQADRFGTSMAKALRVHAEDMRTRRRQRAEEMAAKTTVKLIFPLVLFIFPAIFVVLAGPAIIRIIDMFATHSM